MKVQWNAKQVQSLVALDRLIAPHIQGQVWISLRLKSGAHSWQLTGRSQCQVSGMQFEFLKTRYRCKPVVFEIGPGGRIANVLYFPFPEATPGSAGGLPQESRSGWVGELEGCKSGVCSLEPRPGCTRWVRQARVEKREAGRSIGALRALRQRQKRAARVAH